MASYRIKDKRTTVVKFFLGSKSTVHDVYKISANSFSALIVSGWENEENLMIHLFQEGINM